MSMKSKDIFMGKRKGTFEMLRSKDRRLLSVDCGEEQKEDWTLSQAWLKLGVCAVNSVTVSLFWVLFAEKPGINLLAGLVGATALGQQEGVRRWRREQQKRQLLCGWVEQAWTQEALEDRKDKQEERLISVCPVFLLTAKFCPVRHELFRSYELG